MPGTVPSRRPVAWTSALLLLLTAGLAAARLDGLPSAALMREFLSLGPLPADVQRQLGATLLAPLGAVVVVVFRLTLGVPMLGPFRPILIALAIQQCGVLLGTGFTVFVLAIVTLVRPRLQSAALPYFSRLAVLLTVVVLLQVLILLLGSRTSTDALIQLAFFPIVVLCLTADGFARVLTRDGTRPALSRAATTLGIAVVIERIYAIPGVQAALVALPELMLAEIACVLLISVFGKLELFDSWFEDSKPATPLV